MGILNTTPDSFSDGGDHLDPGAAIAAGLAMVEAGATVLDVGGESTRPGATPVSAEEEAARVLPVLRGLRDQTDAVLSIDTMKASVAAQALDAGADIVNDVTALSFDPEMGPLVARAGCGVVLMHMRGTPQTMNALARYDDVVERVAGHLAERLRWATETLGVDPEAIVLDPGLGFAKDQAHNLRLMRRLDRITALGRPVLLGPSRKRFIGALTGAADPKARDWGTCGAVAAGVFLGAHIFRVHNVRAAHDAARVAHAIATASAEPSGMA